MMISDGQMPFGKATFYVFGCQDEDINSQIEAMILNKVFILGEVLGVSTPVNLGTDIVNGK